MAVKNTLKWTILAYASEPDKNYRYEGDIVEYNGKRYWVSLMNETVEFLGIVKDLREQEEKLKVEMDIPVDVVVEPEYIVKEDGSIKFTGFAMVKK